MSRRGVKKRFRCIDCGKDTNLYGEYYMVADELWSAAGMVPFGGMLCLACLEKRIGRELTPADFTAVVPSPEVWRQHVARREKRRLEEMVLDASQKGASES